MRRTARCLGRVSRLLDRDKTQAERLAPFASDPDRHVDAPGFCMRVRSRDEIERLAVLLQPLGALPSGADNDVGAGLEHRRHAIGLQERAVGQADLTLDHRNAIESFAAFLIRQFEVPETLGRQ